MTGDPPPHPAEGFDEVFDTYFAEIHRYAAKRLGPDAADDVAAQTFLEAFRQRRRYDPERAGVRTWLYGIATKVVGRHQRAETRALRARSRIGPGRHAEEHTRAVIIFDEHTGALLSVQEEVTRPGGLYAKMRPGFVLHYAADRAAQWTDTKPSPPVELPFH